MTTPRVSVCLPNLNTRPFLEERVQTVLAQTFSNWELVISDNYSEDGAWEYFQSVARSDPRVRAEQAPRNGMYENWNACIRRAEGEYVYIATSDDTMAPDCLEKMVQALDAHPECDLAHCPLRFIDEKGRDLPNTQSWWWERSLFALSSGPLKAQPHIRHAPLDGLLLLLGQTVYLSLTQLLIRRSLFDRVGLFEARWGSVGDFNWDMRASLVASTVHVPGTWGSWRMHPSQATASVRLDSPEYARQVDEMIEHAIHVCESHLSPNIRQSLRARWCKEATDIRLFLSGHRSQSNSMSRKKFILLRLLAGSRAARLYLAARWGGTDASLNWPTSTIKDWLQRSGITPTSAIFR